jgi:hypothetical protein
MTPVNSSSFGRIGALVRTYPGGTENLNIFDEGGWSAVDCRVWPDRANRKAAGDAAAQTTLAAVAA